MDELDPRAGLLGMTELDTGGLREMLDVPPPGELPGVVAAAARPGSGSGRAGSTTVIGRGG
ncbi:hypothetical protein SAMN05421810_105169 [Amycolatopsis arida]|uniref:Uncharacterized protein n=1 Tax=Amycolatopsis arida TaxID=587909 RepID=A0A1I5WMJ4_9PSEU|nr:hypothetical protein [Amycolatopsis arida]TDX92343.1 hypothetical protein CLV69_105188 [Amycolatopsis arida]SFQ20606.1 hypothetical protein SAMN05421810_105169 [Amycolatopsis arida]